MFSSMAFVRSTRRVILYFGRNLSLFNNSRKVIYPLLYFHDLLIFTFPYSSSTYLLYSFDVFEVKMKETNIFPTLYRHSNLQLKNSRKKEKCGENSFRVCRFFHFRFAAVINYTISACTFKQRKLLRWHGFCSLSSMRLISPFFVYHFRYRVYIVFQACIIFLV